MLSGMRSRTCVHDFPSLQIVMLYKHVTQIAAKCKPAALSLLPCCQLHQQVAKLR